MIYFDYAATCPLDEEAANAYVKTATEYYGNSSSLHDIGSTADLLLENCRAQLALLLGVQKEGLYFTSGGSESNYLAIQSLLSVKRKKGQHIITGLAEHSSIRGTFKKLELNGYEVTYLPFTKHGMIDVEVLKESIRDDTVLISIQHVNHEIGTIQPIEEIGRICRENNILFHSDCVQAFGKIDLEMSTRVFDSFSFSGHKVYGPKGIGAVFIDPRLHWRPYYAHASHESGFRPGTVNVPAIVSMLVAAQKSYQNMDILHQHYQKLRAKLKEILQPYNDQLILYDYAEATQLPSIVGMRIKGKEGQWVMLECNRLGYAVSTGSACHSGRQAPPNTMKALRVPDEEAKEFIRIAFGKDTRIEDVMGLANTIIEIIEK